MSRMNLACGSWENPRDTARPYLRLTLAVISLGLPDTSPRITGLGFVASIGKARAISRYEYRASMSSDSKHPTSSIAHDSAESRPIYKFISRRCCSYSSRSISAFWILQPAQHSFRLSKLENPPREIGTRWSRVASGEAWVNSVLHR